MDKTILLPNPFVNIIDPLYADLFNIIIGGFIIHILAYYITGCIYEKGSSPGLGSFLYLINYIAISGLIILITKYIKVIWLAVIVFLLIYISGCIFLSNCKNKQYNI